MNSHNTRQCFLHETRFLNVCAYGRVCVFFCVIQLTKCYLGYRRAV
jgi:hypothetical protein